MVAAPNQIPHLKPVPRKLWRVWQNKYVLDGVPTWKRLFFWLIYMPIAWFTYFVVKIPIVNRVDEATGKLGWEEDQGCYSSKERAEARIGGRRLWHAKSMEEDADVPDETCQAAEYICPGSPVAKLYQGRELTAVSVPRDMIEEFDSHLEALGSQMQELKNTFGGAA